MSLKVSLEVPTGQHSLEVACIMPTEFQEVAYDYSNGTEKVIVAACHTKDTGGFVYALNPHDWSRLLGGADPAEFELQPAFVVEGGGRRSARITRVSGGVGRLVFTHIAGYMPRRNTRYERKS